MAHFVSEEEQVEALKRWWRANGGAVIVGIVIGLAAVFGWRYWSAQQASKAEQASLQYEALSQAVKEANADNIRQQGQLLLERFPHSFYAVLGALQLAKLAAEQGDNEAAQQQLRWVVEHTDQEAIKNIARLHLARVLLASGKLDEAQAQLDQVGGSKFTAELEELKGDLYLARNEPAKARAAYQAALNASNGSSLLQMKLDNLPPVPQR